MSATRPLRRPCSGSGETTVLELVSLAGYYGLVSPILNVSRTPIEDGAAPLPGLAGN